ncbi:MAG: hypothetical protein ACR2OR_06155 [Hyphomicrobiales bacterium]
MAGSNKVAVKVDQSKLLSLYGGDAVASVDSSKSLSIKVGKPPVCPPAQAVKRAIARSNSSAQAKVV